MCRYGLDTGLGTAESVVEINSTLDLLSLKGDSGILGCDTASLGRMKATGSFETSETTYAASLAKKRGIPDYTAVRTEKGGSVRIT